MNEQELDKKLAEWAGIVGWRPQLSHMNFTQSLDACFKWLVPKALREIAIIHDVRTQKAFEILLRFWSDKRTIIDEPDADALALCLTIEKLIDSET